MRGHCPPYLLFQKHFPKAEIGNTLIDENRNGHADAVFAYVQGKEDSEDVTYYLILCSFYPVATLRADFYEPGYYFDCLDERWKTSSKKREFDIKVDNNVRALNGDFSSLLEKFGYIFLPYDSDVFQERVRSEYFWTVKVWDYLFYTGDS